MFFCLCLFQYRHSFLVGWCTNKSYVIATSDLWLFIHASNLLHLNCPPHSLTSFRMFLFAYFQFDTYLYGSCRYLQRHFCGCYNSVPEATWWPKFVWLCVVCLQQLVEKSSMVNMLSVCFSRLGSLWVLYCTAYCTKENVRISTSGLDSPFCTVVYIW